MARGTRSRWWLLLNFAAAIAAPAAAAPGPAPSVLTNSGSWRQIGPPPHCWGPGAAYDPVHHRMLVFGGSPFNDVIANSYDLVWELSLDGTPSWTALSSLQSGPYGRESTSAIYDPVRNRLIVFGGMGGTTYGDVWALSLNGTPTWTNITPAPEAGPYPQARAGHTAIYDPVRDRMIVFGGTNLSRVDQNDTWALSLSGTPAWTQLTPAGGPPPVRGWHTAIYDPTRDRMVIFAGYIWATAGSRNDVWALSFSGTPAWTQLTPGNSVGVRNSHNAIYDAANDRMVVWGGYVEPSGGLVALSFAGTPTWSAISPSGPQVAQQDGAAAVYDPVAQRMVIALGGNQPDFSNAWAVSLGANPAWSALAPTGVPNRRQGRAIYDSVRDRMVLINFNSYEIDVLPLAGEPGWTHVVPGVLPPFAGSNSGNFAAVYDPFRDRALIFVGSVVDPPELWALSFNTLAWTRISPTGTPPMNRTECSMIFDPVRDRLVIFGGSYGAWDDMLEDTWVVNFTGTPSWADLTPIAGTLPIGRDGHIAIRDPLRDRMVVFGGHDGFGTFRRDTWSWDLDDGGWQEIVPVQAPPTDRVWSAGIYDAPRDRLLFFGGRDGSQTTDDFWALDLATSTWNELTPPGLTPDARQQHRAIYDPVRDRMIVYGGINGSYLFDDLWVWTPTATSGVGDAPPLARGAFRLATPHPNPSRSIATLAFTLAQAGDAVLEVFDTSGRRVRTVLAGSLAAGPHTARWNGRDDRGSALGSGLYFARLKSGDRTATVRIVRTF